MSLKKFGTVLFCGAVFLGSAASCGDAGSEAPRIDGKALFEKHCNACHAGGGNIVNPSKTLKSSDLEASGKRSVKAIVETMRNPGPGMLKFDEKTISDEEAKAIAEYVLKAF